MNQKYQHIAIQCVEDIEFIINQEYPGLTDFDYQSIAEECRGNLDIALEEARCAHITMRSQMALRHLAKVEQASGQEEGIWD